MCIGITFYKCILINPLYIKITWRIALTILRPNLMNLSGGLNLSGRSNMFGSTKNCIQFFNFNFWREIKTSFWGDLNRDLNSLNSDTVSFIRL